MLLKNVKTPRKFGRNGARGGTQTESISFDEGGGAEGNASGHGGARLALFDNDFGGKQSPSSNVRSPLVAKILEANPVCADCGNVDPE